MPSVFLMSAIMRGWDNILFASMLYVQLFCLCPFPEFCYPDFILMSVYILYVVRLSVIMPCIIILSAIIVSLFYLLLCSV